MNKLLDDFILACGKAEGDFHYEKDTGIPRCWMGDIQRDDEARILVKLKDDNALISSNGILEIRNIKSINFNDAEKVMYIRNNHSAIYVGNHNYLGGLIEWVNYI